MSEPECKCPTVIGGGIEHSTTCAWKIWKTTGRLPEPEKAVEELSVNGRRIQVIAVSRLIVRNTMRMAGPPTAGLVDSIRRDGLRDPIEVLDLCNGYYEITAGIERFKAVVLLGWTGVETYVG
jgi:hypothetical protein